VVGAPAAVSGRPGGEQLQNIHLARSCCGTVSRVSCARHRRALRSRGRAPLAVPCRS
jgi:hypothetical protein